MVFMPWIPCGGVDRLDGSMPLTVFPRIPLRSGTMNFADIRVPQRHRAPKGATNERPEDLTGRTHDAEKIPSCVASDRLDDPPATLFIRAMFKTANAVQIRVSIDKIAREKIKHYRELLGRSRLGARPQDL